MNIDIKRYQQIFDRVYLYFRCMINFQEQHVTSLFNVRDPLTCNGKY